jgi:aminoglycoside phosphotransferase (APT) family kinase protein
MAGRSSDELIDLVAVARFLDGHGLGTGPLEAAPLGDGHSNLTYSIRREGLEAVLRRPPPPPLPPSAHDVVREGRILAALHRVGARVPAVLASCEDLALIGVPFIVMERAEGVPIESDLPVAVDTPEGRRALAEDVIDALVEVHALDLDASGLGGFGRSDGYLERQLRRFLALWDVNRTRDLPLVGRVHEALAARRPASGPATFVHGDYRLGNLLAAAAAPGRVAAILDWELATVGDPLADLGYLLSTYRDPLLSPVTARAGFPSPGELVARYAQRSGRPVVAIGWYEALAHWKSAIFCEDMYRRHLAGERDDAFARAMQHAVPAKLEAAWLALVGGSPTAHPV